MSRKRKPITKPLPEAAEALLWRARILTEILEGLELPVQTAEPIRRLKDAIDDYEFSAKGDRVGSEGEMKNG
jgi:hypothetical protein